MKKYFDLTSLQKYMKSYKTIDYTIQEKKSRPTVVKESMRMIDCKLMSDDFYSNLIDWAEVTQLIFASPNQTITSIKYHLHNKKLCIGTASGFLYLIDIETGKYTKKNHHISRIGTLELYGEHIITGSRDRKSKIIDLRINMPIASFGSHFQEVCGISLNHNNKLLATGGNDNNVFIFDMRDSCLPLLRLTDHNAAVKALSWSPSSEYHLITGGGTSDKTIKHWDISKDTPLVNSYNFESQICNLKWLRNNKILGTFGYSNDDIKLLNDFQTEKCYKGHKNRVIHLSVELHERFFVSGSSDSTIRVWNLESNEKDNITI